MVRRPFGGSLPALIRFYRAPCCTGVEPVSDGDRLVCVGWIQSPSAAPSNRELLFELDTAGAAPCFTPAGQGVEALST